jgi:small subunit ribosomal protein S7
MRGKPAKKRTTPPDPVYGNSRLQRFINKIMLKGKTPVAERLVYNALTSIEQKTKQDPVAIFDKAMANVGPALEVKSRRVGGATYQVPVEVSPERKEALAMRWLIGFARKNKKGRSFSEQLAKELIDASENMGDAVKKKEDTHKMAEANKAFAHYRW